MSTGMQDLPGLVASFALVIAVLGTAELLVARRVVPADVGRKIVHIGVAHWWIVLLIVPMSRAAALVGPVFFVLFNAAARMLAATRFRSAPPSVTSALRVLGSDTLGGHLGTVYYPVSLIVLVLLCLGGPLPPLAGAAGSLVMGWGDGLASLVGNRSRGRSFSFAGARRTIAGSGAMFAASAVVLLVLVPVGGLQRHGVSPGVLAGSLLVAFGATAIEFATPFGLDNITVPLGTALLWSLIIPSALIGTAAL